MSRITHCTYRTVTTLSAWSATSTDTIAMIRVTILPIDGDGTSSTDCCRTTHAESFEVLEPERFDIDKGHDGQPSCHGCLFASQDTMKAGNSSPGAGQLNGRHCEALQAGSRRSADLRGLVQRLRPARTIMFIPSR